MLDAQAAVGHELLDGSSFEEIPRGGGRLDVAQGLLAVGVLFRAGWSKVKGHTAVTEAELDRAATLGVGLLAALGQEDHPSDTKAESDALRLRAYSLLVIAWNECRRAADYLRWYEDDANDFAPALTGLRGPRARRVEPTSDAATEPKPDAAAPTKPDHG